MNRMLLLVLMSAVFSTQASEEALKILGFVGAKPDIKILSYTTNFDTTNITMRLSRRNGYISRTFETQHSWAYGCKYTRKDSLNNFVHTVVSKSGFDAFDTVSAVQLICQEECKRFSDAALREAYLSKKSPASRKRFLDNEQKMLKS